jgi:hypothetical protein
MYTREEKFDPKGIVALQQELLENQAMMVSINDMICNSAESQPLLPLIIEDRRLKLLTAKLTEKLHSINNKMIASRRETKLDYHIKILTDGNSNNSYKSIR